MAITVVTHEAPYPYPFKNNNVACYTMSGDDTTVTDFAAAVTEGQLWFTGVVTLDGAAYVDILSKPAGAGTVVARRHFVAAGSMRITGHGKAGEKLQIELSVAQVTMQATIYVVPMYLGSLLPWPMPT